MSIREESVAIKLKKGFPVVGRNYVIYIIQGGSEDSWEEFVREFVTTTRIGLKKVCLLEDAKWGLKLRDEELIELIKRPV